MNQSSPAREPGRAQHMKDLERKVAQLQQQVTIARRALQNRNRQLRALGLVVYCSAGCDWGVPDAAGVTEDVVAEAERNTRRLRQWWEARKRRLANAEAP